MENHPPSMEEVVSNASLAIIAGADTTSTAINNIFYYLMTDLDESRYIASYRPRWILFFLWERMRRMSRNRPRCLISMP
jgi:cytochrome P450